MPDLKKMLTLEALSAALPSWLKRDTKPEYNADEIDSANTTNQFVSASDKDNWNAKGTYSKPSDGIPKSDLSSIVQTSLEKADSALQSETDPTVPSWAKQPNKPSYTQDEVPDGSTYKRVTQTEKDTWNGKQNALTTTQMQAVNSGIDSTKVAQIETNKNDISAVQDATKELVDEGVKNRFNFDAWKTVTSNRANLSFSGSSVTLESFIADAFTAYEVDPSKSPLFPSEALIPFTIGEQIVFTWDYTANSGQSDDKVFIFAYNSSYQQVSAGNTLAQNKKIQMSIPSGTAYVTFRVGVTTSGNSATYSNLMFCTKSKSDISPAYAPFALPNYDLTELEAEDRSNILSLQNDVISLPRTILSKSPISFVSNTGANLNDYAIFKSSQSELGKRTVNIFDKAHFVIDSVYPNQATGVLENSTSGNTWSIIFKLISSGSETYTISWNKDVMHSNKARIAVYSGNDYPSAGDTPETFIATATTSDDFRYATFTPSSQISYVVIMLYSGSGYDQSTVESYIQSGDFQIEEGNSYSDYEPYGYKMRVGCGNVITPLYFYRQPGDGNALTYKDTSVPIPTIEGNNTFWIMDYSGADPLVYISHT